MKAAAAAAAAAASLSAEMKKVLDRMHADHPDDEAAVRSVFRRDRVLKRISDEEVLNYPSCDGGDAPPPPPSKCDAAATPPSLKCRKPAAARFKVRPKKRNVLVLRAEVDDRKVGLASISDVYESDDDREDM